MALPSRLVVDSPPALSSVCMMTSPSPKSRSPAATAAPITPRIPVARSIDRSLQLVGDPRNDLDRSSHGGLNLVERFRSRRASPWSRTRRRAARAGSAAWKPMSWLTTRIGIGLARSCMTSNRGLGQRRREVIPSMDVYDLSSAVARTEVPAMYGGTADGHRRLRSLGAFRPSIATPRSSSSSSPSPGSPCAAWQG